jgi:hypothetical protein
MVAGGSTGIGYAIARSFCVAGASNVVILGRRPQVLGIAVQNLTTAFPQTKVIGTVCDIFKIDSLKTLWRKLQNPRRCRSIAFIHPLLSPRLLGKPAFQRQHCNGPQVRPVLVVAKAIDYCAKFSSNLSPLGEVPGQFAFWAASPVAAFLCEWDVEELAAGDIREKITADPWYLKV